MSSLLFQLTSGLNATRQVDGCLTPTNEFPKKNIPSPLKKKSTLPVQQQSNSSDNNDNNDNDKGTEESSVLATPTSPIEQSHTHTTIPSPPLSPYARALTFDESDTRFAQLVFPRATPFQKIDIETIETSVSEEEESENEQQPPKPSYKLIRREKKRAFPIEDFKDSLLYVNPYSDLRTPGFKKRQLQFLSQYQLNTRPTFNTKKYSSSAASLSYNSNNNLTNITNRSSHNRDYGSSEYESERPRTRRIAKESSVALETDDSSISRPSTPRKRKPTVRRVDSTSTNTPPPYNFDYRMVADYCPPLSTLPNNNRCLKTEWKGQAMDLSDDPLVGELHPAEVVLASTLRLPANVYLDSKRRLFVEKVKRLKNNLPFRRTDAQKACKIDVNKASRLYASFEKVGWLSDSHFAKFMKK